MTETLTLRVDPATAAITERLAGECARQLKIDKDRIKRVDITRRSIDARQRRVAVNLTVKVHVDTIDESTVTASTPCAAYTLCLNACLDESLWYWLRFISTTASPTCTSAMS